MLIVRAPTRRAQSLYCAACRHRLPDVADERPRLAIATDKPGPAVGQWRNKAIAPYALRRLALRLSGDRRPRQTCPTGSVTPAPMRRAQSLYCAARRYRLLDVADERSRLATVSDKPGPAVGQGRNKAIAPYALARPVPLRQVRDLRPLALCLAGYRGSRQPGRALLHHTIVVERLPGAGAGTCRRLV